MLQTTLGTLNQNSVAEVYSFYFESASGHQFAALALSLSMKNAPESRVLRYSLISMASMVKLSSDLSETTTKNGGDDFSRFSYCFVTVPSQIPYITG